MNFHNFGRVSFIGDSLSLPGKTPGSVFCNWIAQDTSNATKVNKQAVGGFAISYWRPGLVNNKYGKKAAQLSAQAMSTSPSIVFCFLGMNDYAQGEKAITEGILALDKALHGRLFLVGPPQVGAWVREGKVKDGLAKFCTIAKKLLGVRFFDTRPLSEDLTSAKDRPDGIHFRGGAAEALGGRVYHALRDEKSPVTIRKRLQGSNDITKALGALVVVKIVQALIKKSRSR